MPRSPRKRPQVKPEDQNNSKENIPNCKHSIAFLKNSLVSSSSAEVVKLRHPHTGCAATYVVDVDKKHFYELIAFDEGHRAWFLGETVESNGKLYIISPVDITYLILPYLMKASKTAPLEHLLEDEEFPSISLLEESTAARDLFHVADRKGSPELCVWKYNESSTLAWLSERVQKLSTLLQEKKVPTCTAQSLTYVRTMELHQTKEAYLALSHGIISEYLTEDLGKNLHRHLKLPEPKSKKVKPGAENQPPKKKKVEGPLEDYTENNIAPNKIKTAMTAKEKALAKSAVGSKSITSFFTKK